MQEPTSAAEMSSNRIQPVSVLPVSVPPETSQSVYIRVPTATLQTLSPGQQPSGHLYLIEGTLEEFTKFAGTTVDWILWIAHLLCDPLGIGHIFTHTTGTLLDWQTSDRNSTWREVIHGDPLLPGIYEFESTHPIILSKISDWQSRSVTTRGSQSTASTFHTLTLQRDAACAVTRISSPLVASHLIPRRIGSDGVKAIVERFVGVTEATGIHEYDPRIGIMLFSSLNYTVDHYQVGLYHITVSY
jgi:hypothetical protein